ncbi:MAG: YfhO family protein, partial [Chloroflexi bacterium]|nr:YfhO family protein [Chloroflexota bacterium]
VSVIVALGTQIPGSERLAELPFISMLRVPSRALFLTGLSLAALAGYGVETIIRRSEKNQIKRINILLYIVLIFSVLLTIGLYLLEGDLPGGILWGTAALILGVFWIIAGVNGKLPLKIWLPGIFLVAVLDLAVIDVNSFQVKSAENVFAEREAVAQYISAQPGEFRTYSPSYSIPQQTAVRYGIQMADGVDPMQISKYAEFMDEASGVPQEGYSVTVPPFANGDPGKDNIGYSPNAEKLGLLNVGYVVADYEISADGLIHEKQIGEVHIYKNEYQMPRSWVKVEDTELDTGIVPATILENSPNRMRLSAVGPGILTVSEVFYPGWRVEVSGRERKLSIANGLFMAVELDPGLQEIEFSFRPKSITIGIFLFSLGLMGLSLNFWLQNKRSFR